MYINILDWAKARKGNSRKTKVDQVAEEGGGEISFSIKNEAVAALTTLGYNSKIAENTVRNILTSVPDAPLEELIKKSLGVLNK